MVKNCIFCQIAQGREKCHVIWEDEKHLAFLSIYPNTLGVSVVITKLHYSSYVFELSDEVLTDFIFAVRTVAKLIDDKLEGVGRTGVVFEGFGVDHVHAKLFPLHGTEKFKTWKPIKSKVDKYFSTYEGYISSHDYRREEDYKLSEIAKKIRE